MTIKWLGKLSIRSTSLSLLAILTLATSLCVPADAASLPDVAPVTTLLVTTNADSGEGSLRSAIETANGLTTPVEIGFNLPDHLGITISPATPLPELLNPQGIYINGNSQPGVAGGYPVQLDGDDTVSYGLSAAGNARISGLIITRFKTGLKLKGYNLVQGNFIGLWPDTPAGNNYGIEAVADGPQAPVIGGPADNLRNVISGNQVGIYYHDSIQANLIVTNNYIGTDTAGEAAIGNNQGVNISLAAATLTGNLISGNSTGVTAQRSDISLYNNLIGTDKEARYSIANQQAISLIETNGEVGAPGKGNLISGNEEGIYLGGVRMPRSLTIQANTFGTQLNGKESVANTGKGIYIAGNYPVIIGGSGEGAANLFAYHSTAAIATAPSKTVRNVAISQNTFFANNMGIDLDDDGVRTEAPVSNEGLTPPLIHNASLTANILTISGGSTVKEAKIEVFHSYNDSQAQGQGDYFMGQALTDSLGNWSLQLDFNAVPANILLGGGSKVTATLSRGNETSEFAQNRDVQIAVLPDE
jgi:hypothetical protein